MPRRPVAGVQHIAARVGAAPPVIAAARHAVALQRGHLGAAVGQDHQHFLAVGQRLVHQRRKRAAYAVTEIILALTVGAAALAVGGDPCLIVGIVLHLNIIAAFKAAEAHLLQPVHGHELRVREQHLRRLPCTLQRGNIDNLRVNISPAQLGQPLGRKRDVPLTLIALLGVVLGQAVAQ